MDGNTVTLEDGCTLELGAVGKGIGCDVIAEFLKEQKDVAGMILNLGGSSVMTYGESPMEQNGKLPSQIQETQREIIWERLHLRQISFYLHPVIMRNILLKMEKGITIF